MIYYQKIKANINYFTYNYRIFVLDKKNSKYKSKKIKRYVYRWTFSRKDESIHIKEKEGSFCKMKIIYYPNDGTIKIIGQHSEESINKENEKNR